MPTQHAYLAPSASKRWMTCAPSAKAESGFPESDTVYTREGTIAHSLAELLLGFYKEEGELLDIELLSFALNKEHPAEFEALMAQASELGVDFMDMLETVHEFYVVPVFEDYLAAKAKDPESLLLVEAELTLDSFIPAGFGSSDAVIISEDVLHVYDLKYGRGVKVSADHNPQMMCYALGALYGPAELYDISSVVMTILQPRLHHESSFRLTYDDLVSWGVHTLRPAAERAFKGEGEYVPGEHCKFCKAAPRCRALSLFSQISAEVYSEPETLSLEELGDVLAKLGTIKDWAAHVEEYAVRRLGEGANIPGWKIVEGRSVSKLSDHAVAIERLKGQGFEPDIYLKPAELKSITDLKKVLRPKGFDALLGDLVTKTTGKPTLAPESDPRPVFATAKKDFQNL